MIRRITIDPQRVLVLLLVLAAGALPMAAGCGRPAAWPPEPAELRLGEEACAECRMIVSDARYAAQRRSREGAVEFFDDLGCLLTHRRGAALDPLGVFAATGEDGAWTRGDRAYLVHSRDFASPMGYGLKAFASRGAAEAEAAQHAPVVPLINLLDEGAPVPGLRSPDAGGPATP
jgi:copper chaperone NosL